MVSAPSPAGYRADIQGLRGVAVLVVVLFHAELGLSGGFVGVDVFFVISGFVITQGLLRELQRTDEIALRSFYARRVRRLLPALGVMLAIVSVLSMLILSPYGSQEYSLGTAIAASFSLGNLYLWTEGGGYFSPLDESNPFVHTWSLGVEEQFYFMFPVTILVAWTVGKRQRLGRTRSLRAVLLLVFVGSLLASVVLTYEIGPVAEVVRESPRFAFYSPVTRAWEFAVGVGLAVYGVGIRRRWLRSAAGPLGLVLLAYACLEFDGSTPFPGIAAVVPVAATALLILASDGPVASLLEKRWLSWLGDISYSWYLWHWPLIVFARNLTGEEYWVVVAAGASILPAVLSYRFVEARYRQRRVVSAGRKRAAGATTRLAFACVALPLLISGIGYVASRERAGVPSHPELVTASRAAQAGCFGLKTDPEGCTFGTGTEGTIVLLGDSHASAVSDAVVDAGVRGGHQVVVSTSAACPFLTVPLVYGESCRAKQEDSLNLVETLRPDVVVVVNRSTIHALRVELGSADRSGVEIRPASEEALAAWGDAVEQTLRVLQESTDLVVLMSVAPQFTTDEFTRALPSRLQPSRSAPSVSRVEADALRHAVVDAERAAVEATPGRVEVMDPFDSLCGALACHLRLDGRFLYVDNQHLSIVGAAELEPAFAEVFGRRRP